MENLQENEVKVDEIDVDGGWLVTHHTLTRTWDTRVRLDSIDIQLAEKEAKLAEAQKEFDEVQETLATFKTQIEEAKTLKAALDAMPVTPTESATSTPEVL